MEAKTQAQEGMMKLVDIGNPDCKKVLALLDSYLSNELTIETTMEMVRHLERCPGCLGTLGVLERVKRCLQTAVDEDGVSPELKKRVSRMIRKSGKSWFSRAHK